MKKFPALVAAGMVLSSLSYGGYLEGLLKNGGKDDAGAHTETQATQVAAPIKDRNITSERELSLVLLSFEKEAEQRAEAERKRKERLKAEAARKKAAEEKKRAEEAAAKAELNRQQANGGFPTLEEQLRQLGGRDEGAVRHPVVMPDGSIRGNGIVKKVVKMPIQPIYGVFCKSSGCYALGDHRIFKEGDTVNGRKIMEITSSFIRYKDGGKEWYTR